MAAKRIFETFLKLYPTQASDTPEKDVITKAIDGDTEDRSSTFSVTQDLLDTVGGALERLLHQPNGRGDEGLKLFADVARTHEDWRGPLGTSKVFQVALGTLRDQPRDGNTAIQQQALRLIGNCVADNDDVRAVLVSSSVNMQSLLGLLRGDLGVLALSVIYNTCLDYEPAQEQLVACNGISVLYKSRFVSEGDSLACELMEAACANASSHESANDDACISLLRIANRLSHAEPFTSIINAALSVLPVPEHFTDIQCYMAYVSAVQKAHNLILELQATGEPLDDSDELQAVIQVLYSLVARLYEITAADSFKEEPGSAFVQFIKQSVRNSSSSPPSATIAAHLITLANLTRSNNFSVAMVNDGLHMDTIKIMDQVSSSSDKILRSILTYAALQFLGQLSIASANKPPLIESGSLRVLGPILEGRTIFSDEIHVNALTIARRLIAGSIADIVDFSDHGRLRAVFDLYKTSDKASVKLETGRLIAEICRTVGIDSHSDHKDGSSRQTALEIMSATDSIADPLCFAVCNAPSPGAKTEGFFALGIMSSWASSRAAVLTSLEDNKQACNALTHVESKSDMENVRVILANLSEISGVSGPWTIF